MGQGLVPRCLRGHDGPIVVALETGGKPEIDGEDNLDTVALVEACYRGATEHKIFTIDEIRSA